MQERSEEQIISRLFELENSGQAERRAELSDKRFLSLIHDPDRARAYVFQHGTDETEGAEVPPGTEFWEYPTLDEATRDTTSWSLSPGGPASLSRWTQRKRSGIRRPTGPRCATGIRLAMRTC